MNDVNLNNILAGCRQNNRASQQRLYALFYNYVMTIARRYSNSAETSEEVTNDAFFKVFTKLEYYSGDLPFKQWLRRVVINTAIDRFRSGVNAPKYTELPAYYEPEVEPEILDTLNKAELLSMLDRLTPGYRAVFNLYVVDGYSHEEISNMLGISVGSSKSNLSRARQHLKAIMEHEYNKIKRQ